MKFLLDQCPVCSTRLDAVTSISEEGALPTPGDVTMCFYCTTYLRFGEGMKLETLPEKDFEEMEDGFKYTLTQARNYVRGRAPTPVKRPES